MAKKSTLGAKLVEPKPATNAGDGVDEPVALTSSTGLNVEGGEECASRSKFDEYFFGDGLLNDARAAVAEAVAKTRAAGLKVEGYAATDSSAKRVSPTVLHSSKVVVLLNNKLSFPAGGKQQKQTSINNVKRTAVTQNSNKPLQQDRER